MSQPSFMFGTSAGNEVYKDTYTKGMGLSLLGAMISGLCCALQGKCKGISTGHFMFCGGLIAMTVGLISPVFGVPNNLAEFEVISKHFVVLTTMAACSIAGFLLLFVAIKMANPVLVDVVRSTEIVMALILDIIVPSYPINFFSLSFLFKVMGSLLVMASVVGIALSDQIYDKLMGSSNSRKRNEYSDISDEDCP